MVTRNAEHASTLDRLYVTILYENILVYAIIHVLRINTPRDRVASFSRHL